LHLSSIVYFRAIAILLIVAGHSYDLAGITGQSYASAYAINIVTGGTAFFVFISGYMFNHVFVKRYAYGKFMRGKVNNVLTPYLIFASLAAVWFLTSDPDYGAWAVGKSHPLWQGAKLVATGNVMVAYWFVPFIIVMFALSPLHYLFAKAPGRAQAAVVAVTLVLGLLAYRPVANLNVIQSVVYYTPVYLIGILTSVYREPFLNWVRGKEPLLIVASLALVAVQTAVTVPGNAVKPMFELAPPDIMLIQKLLISLTLFAVLERWSDWSSPLLVRVSDMSFSIFFLHPIGLLILGALGHTRVTGLPWVDLWLVTAVNVAFCMAIAGGIKLVLAGNSRRVVGY